MNLSDLSVAELHSLQEQIKLELKKCEQEEILEKPANRFSQLRKRSVFH